MLWTASTAVRCTCTLTGGDKHVVVLIILMMVNDGIV